MVNRMKEIPTWTRSGGGLPPGPRCILAHPTNGATSVATRFYNTRVSPRTASPHLIHGLRQGYVVLEGCQKWPRLLHINPKLDPSSPAGTNVRASCVPKQDP